MAGKKKNINDDDFFEGGDPVEPIDPDATTPDDGDSEGGDAGDVDDAESVDEGAVDDSESPVEDAGAEAEGEDVADGDESSDPAVQLTDLDTAKVAYNEVRTYANRTERENQELRRQLEELQRQNQALEEFDYGVEEPAYDSRAFTQLASEDPRQAFEYALQADNTSDAQTAIAQVQADAAELSALAALAHREGQQDQYAQIRSQAHSAAALAQAMTARLTTAQYEKAQAPLVTAERARTAQAAEQAFNAETGGEYAKLRQQTLQVLKENPNLVTGYGVEDMQKGLRIAYTVAKSQPAPVNVAANVDEIAKAAVEKHIAATRAAKKTAADDAAGADGGRVAPASSEAKAGLKDELYAAQAAQSVGARAFMDDF